MHVGTAPGLCVRAGADEVARPPAECIATDVPTWLVHSLAATVEPETLQLHLELGDARSRALAVEKLLVAARQLRLHVRARVSE